MNRILLIIFLIFGSGFAGEFYKLSELGDFESKQDSVIWVENPIPDVRMGPNETKSIDISNVFSISPDTTLITFDFPVSGNDSMVTANLTQNSVYDPIYLNLISKTVYGSTYVIV
ncbi:MAG: hypothetical protein KKD38_10080, partial [Candidatus Delongbacteria bacterium]|nr:hypothetical protein [Candidatus Delongbacteria bacterium]